MLLAAMPSVRPEMGAVPGAEAGRDNSKARPSLWGTQPQTHQFSLCMNFTMERKEFLIQEKAGPGQRDFTKEGP